MELAFISIKWIKTHFAVRFFLFNIRHSPRRSLFTVAFQCPLTLSIENQQKSTSKISGINNDFNRSKRKCKINYYKNIFEENKKDIKKSWIILKRIIGKHNDKTNFPNEFHIKLEVPLRKGEVDAL